MRQREIKYRAWSNGQMIYSDSFQDERNYSKWDYLRFFFENISSDAIVMQSTGLFDKRGIEIWEGDIIAWKNAARNAIFHFANETAIVFYKHGSIATRCNLSKWLIQDGRLFEKTDGDRVYYDLLVIGDIHKNPELIPKMQLQN